MYVVQVISALVNRLDRDERGATAVEYGLMVAAIAAFIIGTVLILGEQLDGVFGYVTGEMGAITP